MVHFFEKLHFLSLQTKERCLTASHTLTHSVPTFLMSTKISLHKINCFLCTTILDYLTYVSTKCREFNIFNISSFNICEDNGCYWFWIHFRSINIEYFYFNILYENTFLEIFRGRYFHFHCLFTCPSLAASLNTFTLRALLPIAVVCSVWSFPLQYNCGSFFSLWTSESVFHCCIHFCSTCITITFAIPNQQLVRGLCFIYIINIYNFF